MAEFSDTFIEAHFVDSSKELITVYYLNDKKETISYHIPVVWSNPDFQDLLKIVSLESLEKRWARFEQGLKEAQKKREEKYIEKKREPIEDIDDVVKFLNKNGGDNKALFPFKIRVLSIPEIKSQPLTVKQKIQKAKNIYAVMAIVGEVLDG
tara:strand:+ start:334 stop:789 length:456 start_codon:yes stop_codon:yes gene_type:complete